MTRYWARRAWLGPGADGRSASSPAGGPAEDVLMSIEDGRFSAVSPGVASPPPDATRLDGLTLPGLANAHSHAFHRGLRGRTHAGKGTFWTWRDRMYALADRLTPDTYHALARACFAEMVQAGVTCVGEFHYLHHGPGGARYDDPNEIGHRLLAAAAEAGLRITLLDTVYLSSTVDGGALEGPQRRFGDGSVAGWADRHARLQPGSSALVGAAIHSVRAVPRAALKEIAAIGGSPVHVHLSEQRAENEAALTAFGLTPTSLLDEAGLVGPALTAVHATHLSDEDRVLLGDAGASVCFCPTTERDLADGIGPARPLVDAGARLCLGSDSHAVIDLLEEARAVELDERLRDEHRGHFDADELLTAATVAGHRSLGWSDAGTIAVGARADLVTVRLDTVRTAGYRPDQVAAAVVFAATAADISDVVVDGRPVVTGGRHATIDVPRELRVAIEAAWA